MANNEVIKILSDYNLKIIPQRTAVLEVILGLDTHPTADDIVNYTRMNFPHMPFGTVYKILETFVDKGIIHKVKTDDNNIHFDAITEQHHHLYAKDSGQIEDYYDDELNKLLSEYFSKKKIKNFTVEDFKVQIVGKFRENNPNPK